VSTSDESAADPAREGLEHLQTAALEMVAAARSMLDAVEELLDDPQAATAIVSAAGTVGRLVEGAIASVTAAATRSAPDDGDEPRVQRIKVS
jgi:hypothetical protein